MPSGLNSPHGAYTSPRVRSAVPQAAPMTPSSEHGSAKRDLTSWWKQFSKRNLKKEEEKGTSATSPCAHGCVGAYPLPGSPPSPLQQAPLPAANNLPPTVFAYGC